MNADETAKLLGADRVESGGPTIGAILIAAGKAILPAELDNLPCDGSSDPDRQKELRTLQEIVSVFALNGPYHRLEWTQRDEVCIFCLVTGRDGIEMSETDQHESSCLWRQAEEMRRKYEAYWRANRNEMKGGE